MNSPFAFCTVMRDGGVSCVRLKVGGAFRMESARAESAAVSGGGEGGRRRDLGTPSSSTSTVMPTGTPAVASRTSGPSSVIVGGWFARICALLDPAPSAPVSDMMTTLSTT